MTKPKGQTQAINIIWQILNGCRQFVGLNIVHRDIKPANILYKEGVFKIADFGMAKIIYDDNANHDMLQSHCGTPFYMAPQILDKELYSKKCDIWSLGVILYELLYGRLPWNNKRSEGELLRCILRKKLSFPPQIKVSKRLKVILSRMLTIAEQFRIDWD